MKKSDLRTGMIVELRDGKEYVVFIDVCTTQYISDHYINENNYNSLIVNGDNCLWQSLKDYKEDLCNDNSKSYDIMKIYVPEHPYAFMKISYEKENRKLIWERKEFKEMTMKELEEHFGCRIKIVES